MLELRPNCEHCNCDLPADSEEARICSYECTFCVRCVEDILENVCPNCGGGFAVRPIRPSEEHRPGVSLGRQPASSQRVHGKFDRAEMAEFTSTLKHLEPGER